MTAFYAVVVTFIVIATGNVTWQVWSPAFKSQPPTDCRTGLADLTAAVERARVSAGSLSEAGEDAALGQFRGSLSPEWDRHHAIAAACGSDPELARALDVVERLRYAEERAVRREVSELAPLRRRVGQLGTSQPQR
jgi:hypothetical protein